MKGLSTRLGLSKNGNSLFNPASIKDAEGNSLLLQQVLSKMYPTIGGIVYDERTNKGSARPIQLGRAYLFDGTDDKVVTTVSPTLAGELEVDFILQSSVAGSEILIGSITSDVNTRCYLYVNANKITGGIGGAIFAGTTTLVVGTKYTGKVTWNGSNVELFLNGVSEYTSAQTGSVNTTVPLYIGARNNNNGTSDLFIDAKIWNVKIKDGSGNTRAFYKCDEQGGTTSYDSSGNGNHGTISNATLSTFHATQNLYSFQNEVGYSKYMLFDGVDDYISVPTVLTFSRVSFRFDFNMYATSLSSVWGIFGNTSLVGIWIQAGGGAISAHDGTLEISGALSTPLVAGQNYRLSIRTDNVNLYLYNITSGSDVLLTTIALSTFTNFDYVAFGRARNVRWASGFLYNINIHSTGGAITNSYVGRGNTNADWVDTVGSKHGVVFTSPINIYMPRNEVTTTQDATGATIQYSGGVPYDADLEQSNGLSFDGTNDYISPNNSSATLYNLAGKTFRYRGYINTSSLSRAILGKGGLSNGYTLYISGTGKLTVLMPGYRTFESTTVLSINTTYFIDVTFSTSSCTMKINDVTETVVDGGIVGSYVESSLEFIIGGRSGGIPYLFWTGLLYGCELYIDGALALKYNLAEGVGAVAYDSSGNGYHGNIQNGATWIKQDNYHANITIGFSLYKHATLANLFVPYGVNGSPLSITPPTGYTKTSDNPAGVFHNRCETLIDFTSNVLSPVAVINSWETAWAFNTARVNPEFKRTLTSGGVDHRADRFLAYRDALSGTNLSKVNKYVTTKAI